MFNLKTPQTKNCLTFKDFGQKYHANPKCLPSQVLLKYVFYRTEMFTSLCECHIIFHVKRKYSLCKQFCKYETIIQAPQKLLLKRHGLFWVKIASTLLFLTYELNMNMKISLFLFHLHKTAILTIYSFMTFLQPITIYFAAQADLF